MENAIPPTERDHYATLESDGQTVTTIATTEPEEYILPRNKSSGSKLIDDQGSYNIACVKAHGHACNMLYMRWVEDFSIDDNDHDYEEPYWEPANQEEELVVQLSKLKVPVIPVTAIEWVGELVLVYHGCIIVDWTTTTWTVYE